MVYEGWPMVRNVRGGLRVGNRRCLLHFDVSVEGNSMSLQYSRWVWNGLLIGLVGAQFGCFSKTEYHAMPPTELERLASDGAVQEHERDDDVCVVRTDGEVRSQRVLVCEDFSVEEGDQIELWRAYRSPVEVVAFQYRVENGAITTQDGESVVPVDEVDAVGVGRTSVNFEGGRYLMTLAALMAGPVVVAVFVALMR